MADIGKQFERKFKEDWDRMPNAIAERLYDATGGYYGIRNVSDFIGYAFGKFWYLECKTHKGTTFPFSALRQYDDLKGRADLGIHGVRAGAVIFFYDLDRVVYLPISTVTELMKDGKKSFNVTKVDKETYPFYDIPSKKKRVYMDSDYTVLSKLEDGE